MLLLLLPTAFAGPSFRISAGHEWGARMDDSSAPMGPGIQGSIGYAIAAKIARIIPEVGVAYAYNRGTLIPRAGGRLQIGWLLTPGIYAHGSAAIGGPFTEPAFGFDGGLSLDIALPYLMIGGYAGIQAFAGESGPAIPDLNFVGGVQLTLAIPTGKDKDEED